MAKLTFKCNRLTAALGLAAAAMLVGTVPAQAQSAASSGTAAQSDQGASGAANSDTLSQPNNANSATQKGAMQSSGASGTTGMSGSAGASDSQGTSSTSRDMSGGAAVSGTGGAPDTGIAPKAAGSSAIAGGQANSGNYTQGNLVSADRALVLQLAQDNMAELQFAQLAQSKSTNDQVRNFAQQMIDDHTKAANELQQLAQAKNVTLPTSLDKRHRAEEQKLSKLSGDQFDRQYLASAGTSDHTKVHSLLEKIGRSAKDQDVRQLASNLQPDVDKHLQMAQQARRNIAGATSTGSSSTSGSTSSGAGIPADSNK